jgi:hypothetical protein
MYAYELAQDGERGESKQNIHHNLCCAFSLICKYYSVYSSLILHDIFAESLMNNSKKNL